MNKISHALLALVLGVSHPYPARHCYIAADVKKVSVLIRAKGIVLKGKKPVKRLIGCSGTYVSPNTILTAAHCFEGYTPTDIWVRDPAQATGIRARIVRYSHVFDLALLGVDGSHTYARVGKTPEEGDAVINVGSPEGLEFLISNGIIAALNYQDPDYKARYLITTAMINSGSSGGGAFNEGGQLIGVNTMAVGIFGWCGITFAVDTNTMREFLK